MSLDNNELLNDFIEEGLELLSAIEEDLLFLEKHEYSIPEPEKLKNICRFLHTLKGNSGFLGLSVIKNLTHRMEDIFVLLQKNTLKLNESIIEQLFKGLDKLQEIFSNITEQDKFDISELLASYSHLIENPQQPEPIKIKKTDSDAVKLNKSPAPLHETTGKQDPLIILFSQNDDMVQRIDTLKIISDTGNSKLVPHLWNFLDEPLDEAVLVILESTLEHLLTLDQDLIISGLTNPSSAISSFCVRLAGNYQLRSAIPVLCSLIKKTGDDTVLINILEALGKIGQPTHHKTENKYIIKPEIIIKFIFHPSPFVALAAITATGKLDPSGKRLIALFRDMNEVQAFTIINLIQKQPSDEILKFLADNIHHSHPIIRRIISEKLLSLWDNVASMVIKKLIYGTTEEQIIAANIISKAKDPSKLPFLAVATKSENPNIRHAVYEAMTLTDYQKTALTCFDGLFDSELIIRLELLAAVEKFNDKVLAGNIKRSIKNSANLSRLTEALAYLFSPNLVLHLFNYPELVEPVINGIISSKNSVLIENYHNKISKDTDNQMIISIWLNKYTKLEKKKRENKLSVLIADDSLMVRKLMSSILKEDNYSVTLAIDGQEALDYFSTESFELLITDLNMPVMNGLELVRELRKLQQYSSLPVIMVTTEKEEEQKKLLLDAGVNIILPKPFNRKDLLGTIEQLVNL
jgi:CheY-like chemotaxis protein/HPt (histidine-containing phosphotransfer) domain-containing protein